ncbi:hypothetical protein RIF29_27987 [Crotalaria pallida]|uniref:Uncharacterized protein n=1 Tax=Crotalaria pallida TaxID=3830 RepID=A0AAN9I651_CROPI
MKRVVLVLYNNEKNFHYEIIKELSSLNNEHLVNDEKRHLNLAKEICHSFIHSDPSFSLRREGLSLSITISKALKGSEEGKTYCILALILINIVSNDFTPMKTFCLLTKMSAY